MYARAVVSTQCFHLSQKKTEDCAALKTIEMLFSRRILNLHK